MTRRTADFLSIFAAALSWLAIAATAFAADPVARAAMQSKGTLYVGQEVLIDVDVLVPNYFLQPPQFPQFDLPGAIVTLQDGRALNLNESIEGTDYSGIRRTYVVTPHKAGDFTLPPAEIPFGYAAVPGQTTQGKVTIPALKFSVEAAPGAAGGVAGVVAAKVTLTQELDQDPKALKAGDTLVRTITVRAEGMRAMMIPEPDLSAPNGVREYSRDPALSEETDRNGQDVAGIRKDVASYLFADPGTYALPAIELSWFDPATATTQSASAPAVTVVVAAAPAPSTALAPPASEPEASKIDWLLIGVVAAAAIAAGLVIGILALGLSRLQSRWAVRQSERSQSEAAYFRHVEDACHDRHPAEIAKSLDAWARRAGIVPLAQWLQRFGDAKIQTAYSELQRRVYGRAVQHHHKDDGLLGGLQHARRQWLNVEQGEETAHGNALPPLNPIFDNGLPGHIERVHDRAM